MKESERINRKWFVYLLRAKACLYSDNFTYYMCISIKIHFTRVLPMFKPLLRSTVTYCVSFDCRLIIFMVYRPSGTKVLLYVVRCTYDTIWMGMNVSWRRKCEARVKHYVCQLPSIRMVLALANQAASIWCKIRNFFFRGRTAMGILKFEEKLYHIKRSRHTFIRVYMMAQSVLMPGHVAPYWYQIRLVAFNVTN